MYKNIKKNSKGFTIIEVLIVLAIAALIMLIVFLAVPALQRNSRNNSRRNDASRISSAVTEYINNNNGKAPAAWSDFDSYIGNMSFYTTAGDVSAVTSVTDADAPPQVRTGATCATDGSAVGGGPARQFVVLYAVETGGAADDTQCISS